MVKIITDTTSVLSKEIAQKYHIPIIPQVINFGVESFYEGIDMDISTFIQRIKSSKLMPKTAAPPPELFKKEFEILAPLGETIFCIHPSAEVSGTVRSAIVASRDFPNLDIRVIDTRTVASPLGTLVELAARWAESGVDADSIETRLKLTAANCHIYFLVATLEYLSRGGRIGGASALLGSVLQIKPILMMDDGKVNVFEKERTYKRAMERIKEIVLHDLPTKNAKYLTILHSDALYEAQALATEMQMRLKIDKIPIYNMPPAIVAHGGPGIIGMGFFTGDIPE
jgi:DegV family protein with EDD domain